MKFKKRKSSKEKAKIMKFYLIISERGWGVNCTSYNLFRNVRAKDDPLLSLSNRPLSKTISFAPISFKK